MVSHTRNVSSHSRSARSGGAGSNRSNASHSAPKPQNHGSHRANGPQKKQNKRKHLVLKWALGIFAALLAAGIGLFAYMYITTEIPEPEKFALAEKTTVYYADAVLWAVKEDITKGTTSTTFSPDADCTRAQIVTFLWRCKK